MSHHTKNEVKNTYEMREKEGFIRLSLLSRQLDLLVFARVALFGAALFFFYWGLSSREALWFWPAGLCLLSFVLLVRLHSSLKFKKSYYQAYNDINKTEQKLLENPSEQIFPNGAEFANAKHPFSSDLDLFGPYSFFAHLNRSVTLLGKSALAKSLSEPLSEAEAISKRQKAVAEMAQKLDFRQKFYAHGKLTEEKAEDYPSIEKWVTQESLPGFAALGIVVPILSLGALATWILGGIGIIPMGFALIISLLCIAWAGISNGRTMVLQNEIGSKVKVLQKYAELMKLVENENFKSEELQSITKVLQDQGGPASKRIKRLALYAELLDYRMNVLAGLLLNGLFAWDMLCTLLLRNWKKQHASSLQPIFMALAEVDARASLGGFAYNHPDFVYAKTGKNILKIVELVHPLLPENKRVTNSLSQEIEGQIRLITGSNMAGKSTFLRSLGISVIMSRAGLPVCAKEMEFEPCAIYSSMRVSDSLEKGESYFFAELLRLQYIVQEVEKGETCIVLLDEILRGTNSNDKQSGSLLLLKKLLGYKAFVLLATHDTSLGSLENEFPKQVKNCYFEGEIKDNELYFDYKMKEGVCEKMNASFLLRKMKILS